MNAAGRIVRSWLTWCVVAALAVRLPNLDSPPGSDEGGLLLVGESWARGGDSLYGPYWVDRPPLLVMVHELATHTGGVVGLRLIGAVAAVATIVCAWALGRSVAGTVGARCSAVTATAVVGAPAIGWPHVSSEVLAAPFVIGAVGLVLRAVDGRTEHPVRLAALAGALAVCAPLLKQNLVGGLLAIAVVLGVSALRRQSSGRRALVLSLAALAGAAGVTTVVLTWSAIRGTYPTELWQALVPFRAEAAAAISEHATDATDDRLRLLTLVCVVGGPLAIALLAVRTVRRTWSTSALVAVVLLAWATVSLVAGGSYWLHYLGQLAPGLSLAVAAAVSSDLVGRRAAQVVSGYALVMSLVGVVVFSTLAARAPPTDREVLGRWLDRATLPGDTAVVSWGHPSILYEADVHSPYEQLWSLPVRVRDPELTQFVRVLEGPRAPDWVVTRGRSTDSWGIEASTADDALAARYDVVADLRGYRVHLLKGMERAVPATP